jgi:hypothetical protein
VARLLIFLEQALLSDSYISSEVLKSSTAFNRLANGLVLVSLAKIADFLHKSLEKPGGTELAVHISP